MYEVNTLGLPGATFTHFGEKHIQTNTDDGSEYETTFQVLDKFVLMQYTGLKDKKGKEIYEGDILKLESWVGTQQVAFIEGAFCLADKDGNYVGDIHYIHHAGIMQSEIIGNIYENPELIK